MKGSKRADENKIMNKYVLIETYKEFLTNPSKVFVASDFKPSHLYAFRHKYLDTLISLGLIEQVEVYSLKTKRRGVKGYKLLTALTSHQCRCGRVMMEYKDFFYCNSCGEKEAKERKIYYAEVGVRNGA